MQVGDKVVCVDDSPGAETGLTLLKINEIYTVRSFVVAPNGEEGVRLEEVVIPFLHYRYLGNKEMGFRKERFRPIDYSFGEQVAEKFEIILEPMEV